jgi:hypothetical protein
MRFQALFLGVILVSVVPASPAKAAVMSEGVNHDQCCPTCPETVPWSCRYLDGVNRSQPIEDRSTKGSNKEADVGQ